MMRRHLKIFIKLDFNYSDSSISSDVFLCLTICALSAFFLFEEKLQNLHLKIESKDLEDKNDSREGNSIFFNLNNKSF